MMLYMFTKTENISKGFQSYLEDTVRILKFSKGHISVNSIGGVMVLNLFTSTDSILYLYQIKSKYLRGFQSYVPEK